VLAAAVAGCALVSGSARANSIIVTFNNTSAGPGGTTNFNYTVSLTQGDQNATTGFDNQVRNPGPAGGGDYFSVVDFAGYSGFSSFTPTIGTWTGPTVEGTTTLVTTAGSGGIIGDDPALPNIRYNYNTGPTITGNPTTLGTLLIRSIYSATTTDAFGGRYTNLPKDGSAASSFANVGSTTVPTAVPLPSAVWGGLGLLGVCGIGAWNRRRQLA
jgi:MYXO-CTERM domain-containing protein